MFGQFVLCTQNPDVYHRLYLAKRGSADWWVNRWEKDSMMKFANKEEAEEYARRHFPGSLYPPEAVDIPG